MVRTMNSARESTDAPRPRQALVRLAARRSVRSTGGVKKAGQRCLIINPELESEDVPAAASTGNAQPKRDDGTKRLPSMQNLKSLLRQCMRPKKTKEASTEH